MSDLQVSVVVAASVVSCAIGAAGGYILTKKYVSDQYELLIEEEVKKAKEYYQEHPPQDISEEVPTVEVVVTDEAQQVESVKSVDVEDPDEVYLRDKHIQYNKIAANYNAPAVKQAVKAKPNAGETVEQFENRLIDEAKNLVRKTIEKTEPELIEEVVVVEQNLFDTHGASDKDLLDRSARSADHPYVIDSEEFEDAELDFSQNTLTYYAGDNVLTDESDQPVNIGQIVGESNLQFGIGSGDKNIVYVRNHRLEVDFEICKDPGYYTEEVLGVAPKENKRKS